MLRLRHKWQQWLQSKEAAQPTQDLQPDTPPTAAVARGTVARVHAAAAPPTAQSAILPPTPAARLFTQDAMQRAWLAVKRARGGPGVDHVTLTQFEASLPGALDGLRQELVGGSYRPQPMQRLLVLKQSGAFRSLLLWAVRDRVAQRAVYDLIAPFFDRDFLPCSHGFRPGRGPQTAIAALERVRDDGNPWVVDGDIQDCFDTLPVEPLLRLVQRRVHDPLVMQYVAGWLRARILTSADGVAQAVGAAQGGILSPLLANIYLHELDRVLLPKYPGYLRYADDLVICCHRKADALAALAHLRQELRQLNITLNERKTRIVHFDQGFEWLGHFFVHRKRYPLTPG